MVTSDVSDASPPLRVILAPSAYYPHVGGIEELTRQLALTLESRGHEVSVLTNRWPEGVVRNEALDGVTITRLRFPLPAASPRALVRFALEAPTAAIGLVRHVRARSPHALHVIGAGPQGVYIGALAPLLGTRIVFTAQGELTFDADEVFRHSVVLRSGLRRLLRVADAVTACSEFVLDELEVFRPGVGGVVVPNGVNPEDFRASGSREGDPYILGVGRLVPQKGFDVLIRAFASPAFGDTGSSSRATGLNAGASPNSRGRSASQAASTWWGQWTARTCLSCSPVHVPSRCPRGASPSGSRSSKRWLPGSLPSPRARGSR